MVDDTPERVPGAGNLSEVALKTDTEKTSQIMGEFKNRVGRIEAIIGTIRAKYLTEDHTSKEGYYSKIRHLESYASGILEVDADYLFERWYPDGLRAITIDKDDSSSAQIELEGRPLAGDFHLVDKEQVVAVNGFYRLSSMPEDLRGELFAEDQEYIERVLKELGEDSIIAEELILLKENGKKERRLDAIGTKEITEGDDKGKYERRMISSINGVIEENTFTTNTPPRRVEV